MNKRIAILLTMFMLMPFGLTGCGSSYITQGQVGLVVSNTTGKIDKVVEPGFRMVVPIGQHIISFPIIKQQYVMVRDSAEGQTTGDDSIQVNSLEGQAFSVDASVEYTIRSKADVAPLYQKYAMDFETIVQKYYRSKFRAAFIDAFSNLPMAKAITGEGRTIIIGQVKKELQELLKDDGIIIGQVMIRQVYPPQDIANSIAAKTKAENELVRSRTVAQQQIVEANAQAQAKLIRAQAEAKANHLLSSSLTPTLVRMRAIETINPKVQMVLDSKTFLNMTGLNVGQTQQ